MDAMRGGAQRAPNRSSPWDKSFTVSRSPHLWGRFGAHPRTPKDVTTKEILCRHAPLPGWLNFFKEDLVAVPCHYKKPLSSGAYESPVPSRVVFERRLMPRLGAMNDNAPGRLAGSMQ